MQIWPAIDIRGGKCVRLEQGDYAKERVYGGNPADMADRWVSEGAQYLHLVDLDGARDGASINRSAIKDIVTSVNVPCELGGGIRDEEAIADYLEMGLSRLVIGTKAIKDPNWLHSMCAKYPYKLVVGIDARDGQVATDGWLETSDTPATELARVLADLPLAAIVYTDIACDGMLAGPNLESLREMADATPLPVIASGGITTTQDLTQVAQMKVAGCIVGRSLYEGRMTLKEALNAVEMALK